MIPRLGVNIDHVATVRNARNGALPDPVRAALLAIDHGADGITAHLREDRRHIREKDIKRLMAVLTKPLNFEMAVTDEMVALALATRPHATCLVPERREEQTTEGGLDVVGGFDQLHPVCDKLKQAGIRASLFIEANQASLDAAVALGVPVVELHTGAWCEAIIEGRGEDADRSFAQLKQGAAYGHQRGLEIHVGHGLDYTTATQMAALPQVAELNIGHFMIGESIFDGLPQVIQKMKAAIARGYAQRV